MKKVSGILVPIDFADPSLAALDFGVLLASRLKAPLTLLAVEQPFYPAEGYAAYIPNLKETAKRVNKVFEECVKKAARRGLPHDGFKLKILAKQGVTVPEILHTADTMGVDLIVMGTHGRKGITRAILGSVTEQVVRRAKCPVLTLRGEASSTLKKKISSAPL